MALLTGGAIVAGLASISSSVLTALGNAAHAAIIVAKIVVAATLAAAFAVAVGSLIGFLSHVVYNSVVGDFFRLISVCLPFDPVVVFGAILAVVDGIVVFLVAQKVYELCTNLMRTSA